MKIFKNKKESIKLSDFFIIDEANHIIEYSKIYMEDESLDINFKNFVCDYNTIPYEKLIINNDSCIEFYTKERCIISSDQDIYPIIYEYKYINKENVCKYFPFNISTTNHTNIKELYLESIKYHLPCKEIEYLVKYVIQLTKDLKYIDDMIEIRNLYVTDIKEIREISTLEMYNSLFSNKDYFSHYLLIDNEDEFKEYDTFPYTSEDYCLLKLINTIRSLGITDAYYIDKLIDCVGFDYSNYQTLLEWTEILSEYPPEVLATFMIKKLNNENIK